MTGGDFRAGHERDPPWHEKVIRLHRALDGAGVPHAFGGAIAVNYHREPRSTLDIDINIFLCPADQQVALEALRQLYHPDDLAQTRREIERVGQARSRWGDTFIDLFFSNTEFHEAMAARVVHEDFGDIRIPVLSIDDLIVCKVLFDRPRDWIDVEAVVMSDGERLDRRYIERWLSDFLEPSDHRFARLRSLFGR